MALHQHLRDTCRTTEVTINLERRMSIEEIRISPPFFLFIAHQCQLIGNQLVGMVAIKQTFHPILQPVEGSPR